MGVTRKEIIEHMKVMGQNAAKMDEVMLYVMTVKDLEVVMEAAEILEAQEPRVMTLEEVSALPADSGENTPVWMETRIVTDKGVLTYLEASLLWSVEDGWWRRFGPVHSGWEDRKAEAYNITWRCWTSRPTAAERVAAAWNG